MHLVRYLCVSLRLGVLKNARREARRNEVQHIDCLITVKHSYSDVISINIEEVEHRL